MIVFASHRYVRSEFYENVAEFFSPSFYGNDSDQRINIKLSFSHKNYICLCRCRQHDIDRRHPDSINRIFFESVPKKDSTILRLSDCVNGLNGRLNFISSSSWSDQVQDGPPSGLVSIMIAVLLIWLSADATELSRYVSLESLNWITNQRHVHLEFTQRDNRFDFDFDTAICMGRGWKLASSARDTNEQCKNQFLTSPVSLRWKKFWINKLNIHGFCFSSCSSYFMFSKYYSMINIVQITIFIFYVC